MRPENQIRNYRFGAGPASMIPISTSQLLSEEEIIRQLRMLRFSPENRAAVRGGRKIPIRYVAGMAGLNRTTLYRAMMEGRISDRSRVALSPVLIMLQVWACNQAPRPAIDCRPRGRFAPCRPVVTRPLRASEANWLPVRLVDRCGGPCNVNHTATLNAPSKPICGTD